MAGTQKRFRSVGEYIAANEGMKKGWIAKRWKLSRFQMVAVIYPDRYPVALNEEQVALIATDLNQPPSYVRKLYPRRAA